MVLTPVPSTSACKNRRKVVVRGARHVRSPGDDDGARPEIQPGHINVRRQGLSGSGVGLEGSPIVCELARQRSARALLDGGQPVVACTVWEWARRLLVPIDLKNLVACRAGNAGKYSPNEASSLRKRILCR